jgi:protein TonB
MKVYDSSRRSDILAASVVPTVVLCLVVWFDQGHMFRGLPTLRIDPAPPSRQFVLPPEPVEMTDTVETSRSQPVVAPVPQIPDSPQPIRWNSITQPIEPPVPEGPISDTIKIPESWSPGGTRPAVFDPSMLDQQPAPSFQARPLYPSKMKQEGQSGSVLVDFIVDSEGNVRNASAVRFTTPDFAASAVSAVSRWKFKPGRRAGHAVFTHLQVPIEFTLNSADQ